MIDLESADGAQNGRCRPTHPLLQLPWCQRVIAIGKERAENCSREGCQLIDIVRLETATHTQRVPEAIDLGYLAGLGIDPVDELRLLVVLVSGLTVCAKVAQ
jgi:hypothetical protein